MCEMIKIMQEYGEVACCLGSSANLRNSCLFLQSDIRSGGHCRYLPATPDPGLQSMADLALAGGPRDLGMTGRRGSRRLPCPVEMGLCGGG